MAGKTQFYIKIAVGSAIVVAAIIIIAAIINRNKAKPVERGGDGSNMGKGSGPIIDPAALEAAKQSAIMGNLMDKDRPQAMQKTASVVAPAAVWDSRGQLVQYGATAAPTKNDNTYTVGPFTIKLPF